MQEWKKKTPRFKEEEKSGRWLTIGPPSLASRLKVGMVQQKLLVEQNKQKMD